MSVLRRILAEVLLWLAAAAGLICIVLVILAYALNISLVLFRTGSMEPTIAAGSVAVVQEIAAEEIEVGDVLTVERAGQLPVTHRVTSVEQGERSEQRVITMQGDANETEDPYPYEIAEARVTLFSVPGLAQPISQMSNPYVLGSITLAASVLVGWAFWPRGTRRERPVGRSAGEGARSRPRHAGRTGAAAVLMVGAAGLMLSGGAEPAQASPQVQRESVEGRSMSLESLQLPSAMENLAPGSQVVWDVELSVDAAEEGVVVPGVSAEGSVPLEVQVYACGRPWSTGLPQAAELGPDDLAEDCPQGFGRLAELDVPLTGEVEELEEGPARDRWFRLLVTVPHDVDASAQSATTVLRLHVTAFGEELSVSAAGESGMPGGDPAGEPGLPGEKSEQSEQGLAITGAQFAWLAALSVAAVLLGRLMLRHVRREELKGDEGWPVVSTE